MADGSAVQDTLPKSLLLDRVNQAIQWWTDWSEKSRKAIYLLTKSSKETDREILGILRARSLDSPKRQPTDRIPGTILRDFSPLGVFALNSIMTDEEQKAYIDELTKVGDFRDVIEAIVGRTGNNVRKSYASLLVVQDQALEKIGCLLYQAKDRLISPKKIRRKGTTNDKRDKWIHDNYDKYPLKELLAKLNSKSTWAHQISTEHGLTEAMKRYANKHALPCKSKRN